MPYLKVGPWVNGAVPPISAANLDTVETQYDEATGDVFGILTTRGDLPFRGAANWERLPKGTSGQFLKQGANDPEWVPPSHPILLASDTLQHSNDAGKSTTNVAYTKLKEIKLGILLTGNTIRLKFTLSAGGDTAYGRIYRNGVAIGTERTTAGIATFSEDFDITSWVNDDLIQIYAHSTAGDYETVSDFRVYYDIAYLVTTNQDP